jgi:hypothetical protein
MNCNGAYITQPSANTPAPSHSPSLIPIKSFSSVQNAFQPIAIHPDVDSRASPVDRDGHTKPAAALTREFFPAPFPRTRDKSAHAHPSNNRPFPGRPRLPDRPGWRGFAHKVRLSSNHCRPRPLEPLHGNSTSRPCRLPVNWLRMGHYRPRRRNRRLHRHQNKQSHRPHLRPGTPPPNPPLGRNHGLVRRQQNVPGRGITHHFWGALVPVDSRIKSKFVRSRSGLLIYFPQRTHR